MREAKGPNWKFQSETRRREMSQRESSGIMVRAGSRSARSAVLSSLRKKSFGRHSERSEESLLIQNKSPREILRAKSALRMTVFRLFPQTVRWVFALAALSALIFVMAGPIRAQSQSTASKSAPAGATTPAGASVVDAAPAMQAATPNPAAEPLPAKPAASAAGGNHEGIKVSGHWVIEVKNPDGKVVTHREFENNLVTGGQGDAILSNLLTGNAVAGVWDIQLQSNTSPAACPSDPTNGGLCTFVPPGNSLWTLQALDQPPPFCPGANYCFTTLTVTNINNSIVLAANFTPSWTGAVNYVLTALSTCPQQVVGAITSPAGCLTANLDAQIARNQFTNYGPIQPPVPFSPGQFVTVDVTFSFQ
jgi:hypothetical protein